MKDFIGELLVNICLIQVPIRNSFRIADDFQAEEWTRDGDLDCQKEQRRMPQFCLASYDICAVLRLANESDLSSIKLSKHCQLSKEFLTTKPLLISCTLLAVSSGVAMVKSSLTAAVTGALYNSTKFLPLANSLSPDGKIATATTIMATNNINLMYEYSYSSSLGLRKYYSASQSFTGKTCSSSTLPSSQKSISQSNISSFLQPSSQNQPELLSSCLHLKQYCLLASICSLRYMTYLSKLLTYSLC